MTQPQEGRDAAHLRVGVLFSLLLLFLPITAFGQNLTPVGIGDLPFATTMNPTDMFVICQVPPCRAGTQLNSAALNRLPLTFTPPLTYNSGTMTAALSIDSTLTVVSGQLHVVNSGVPIPTSPLVSGNGTILGNVALGTNLSLTGTFPNQTLNATGGGGGAVNQVTGSGQITVSPTTGNVVVGSTGLTGGLTIANACTGNGCTPTTSCLVFSNGISTSFASGACSSVGTALIDSVGTLVDSGGSLVD